MIPIMLTSFDQKFDKLLKIIRTQKLGWSLYKTYFEIWFIDNNQKEKINKLLIQYLDILKIVKITNDKYILELAQQFIPFI